MPKVHRTAAIALLIAAAAVRGTNATRAATPEPQAAPAGAVDRGARQIVANHPIIPVPSAAWPAIVGVAFVARRAIGAAARGR